MTNEFKEDSAISKNELDKILMEQDWRFSRLLIGLSIGIILFSFEIFKEIYDVCYVWILLTSWICLFISFWFGVTYLLFYRKVLYAYAKKIENKTDNKSSYDVDIKLYDKIIGWLAKGQLFFFAFGVSAISIYAFINFVLTKVL